MHRARRRPPLAVALVSALLWTAGFASAPARAVERRIVSFPSADGTLLAGTFYDAHGIGPGVLFLTSCAGERDEMQSLAAKLSGAGPRVLAFDYRSEGGSRVASGPKAIEDALAAYRYLIGQARVSATSIGVIAVGCSAKLAVELAAQTANVAILGLISPELDGVADARLALFKSVPMLLFASDAETDAKRLFAAGTNVQSQLTTYRRPERGMELYAREPAIKNIIDDWWEQVYGGWAQGRPLLAAPADEARAEPKAPG